MYNEEPRRLFRFDITCGGLRQPCAISYQPRSHCARARRAATTPKRRRTANSALILAGAFAKVPFAAPSPSFAMRTESSRKQLGERFRAKTWKPLPHSAPRSRIRSVRGPARARSPEKEISRLTAGPRGIILDSCQRELVAEGRQSNRRCGKKSTAVLSRGRPVAGGRTIIENFHGSTCGLRYRKKKKNLRDYAVRIL